MRRLKKLKVLTEILLLIGFDLLFYYISALLAYWVSSFFVDTKAFPLKDLLALWWIPIILLLSFANEKIYTQRLPFWDETQRIFKYTTLTFLIIFTIVSFGEYHGSLSRVTLFLLWLFIVILFPLEKFIIKHIMYKFDFYKRKTLVLGAGTAGKQAVKEIFNQDYLGHRVIGFLDDDEKKIGKSYKINGRTIKVLGKLKDFNDIASQYAAQSAILALPDLPAKKLAKIIIRIQKRVRELIIVPEIHGVSPLNTETFHVYDLDLMMLKVNNNVRSSFNQFVKRTFDIVVSVLLLPILLPVIGVLAYLIKKESPGNVFYAHNRIGKDGKIVPVLKFRSMFSDSKERLEKLLESDPAIREE